MRPADLHADLNRIDGELLEFIDSAKKLISERGKILHGSWMPDQETEDLYVKTKFWPQTKKTDNANSLKYSIPQIKCETREVNRLANKLLVLLGTMNTAIGGGDPIDDSFDDALALIEGRNPFDT